MIVMVVSFLHEGRIILIVDFFGLLHDVFFPVRLHVPDFDYLFASQLLSV